MLLLTLALIVGSLAPAAGQGPPPVPKDLEIVYGFGATHAEWGRTTYRVTADGVMTVEKTQGFGDGAKIEKASYALTPEELGQVVRKVEEARFFRLKESYANNRIMDGYSSFLRIQMNGKAHSVSVVNTSVKRFNLVADCLEKLVAAKAPPKKDKT
jgi:hypothetical protein